MKKRIVTFLTAFVLTLGMTAEGICALPVTAKEPSFTEDRTERIYPGGLRQIEYHEVEEDILPEVFEPESKSERKASAVYKNDWDKYSTNYYYNQLTEQQQAFWDQLDALCLSYLTGTETISMTRDSYGRSLYVTKTVSFTNMSSNTVTNIMRLFHYSNPQYYFLNLGIYGRTNAAGTAGTRAFTVLPKFANGAARSQATAQMKAVIDDWMAQINAQPDDLSKEKMAHDLICDKVEYDSYYLTSMQNEYNQVAYSVFCTDTTVCAGYSQAMQLLMNGAGIDCGIVTSTDHEWNIVRLNDSWYYTDLTWDDLSADLAEKYGQGMIYNYFNRSYQHFMNDEPRAVESHTPETIWNGYLPDLTYDSGADGTDYGTIYTPSETLNLPQISCSGSRVTITAPSGTIYYTTDGKDPSAARTRAKKYTGAFALSGTTTVRAIVVKNGFYDSQVIGTTITPKYNVVFSANGGYIGSKSVTSVSNTGVAYNTRISLPGNPKRKGYAFLGWYTGKSGGSKLTGAFPVRADATYYAHWSKINTKKKAVISSVKNSSSKTIKVKIKDLKTVSGYQVRYSLRQNMASSKKKEVTETTCTINKLQKGKTYYVQVRMYQKESVSGKKKYGPWSKAKTVKIKK